MSQYLIEITNDSFQQEVRESQLPVLVDFWGPNCMPCLGLMPTIEALADAYAGKIKFCKLNTAENRRMTKEFKIMSIPTLLFFKNGEIVAVLRGAASREKIEEKLKTLMG